MTYRELYERLRALFDREPEAEGQEARVFGYECNAWGFVEAIERDCRTGDAFVTVWSRRTDNQLAAEIEEA